MSAILETQIQSHKINAFQDICDLFSKQCAVLLGFFVPVSTFATHVVLFCLIASWFLAGGLKENTVYHKSSRFSHNILLFGVFV